MIIAVPGCIISELLFGCIILLIHKVPVRHRADMKTTVDFDDTFICSSGNLYARITLSRIVRIL
jgi:hypothetical protein